MKKTVKKERVFKRKPEEVKPDYQADMVAVESSNINAVGYDWTNEACIVEFKGGGQYVYKGVPAEAYEELTKAKSIGKHLNATFKNAYKFEKLEKDPKKG